MVVYFWRGDCRPSVLSAAATDDAAAPAAAVAAAVVDASIAVI